MGQQIHRDLLHLLVLAENSPHGNLRTYVFTKYHIFCCTKYFKYSYKKIDNNVYFFHGLESRNCV